MIPIRNRLLAVAAALTLSGCAGMEARVDDLAQGVEARSTCHSPSGEWIATGRDCTVSYSISKTVSTTTTTTTVETTPGAPPVPADDDAA